MIGILVCVCGIIIAGMWICSITYKGRDMDNIMPSMFIFQHAHVAQEDRDLNQLMTIPVGNV